MKFLKGLAKAILVLILMNVLMALTFSYTTPKIITNGILRDIVAKGIINNMISKTFNDNENAGGQYIGDNENSLGGQNGELSEEISGEVSEEVNQALQELSENEEVKKLLESEDVQNLLDKYFNVLVNGLSDDGGVDEINVEEDIITFISNHREELQTITNEEITDQAIEEMRQEMKANNINGSFKELVNETKTEVPSAAKSILTGFKFFMSDTFRLILFIVIAIDILLMALIDFSIGKTFKSVGWCMIPCGSMVLLLGFASKVLFEKLVEAISSSSTSIGNITVDTSALIIAGGVLLGVGIVLCIIGMILNKIFKKKDNNSNHDKNNDDNSTNKIIPQNAGNDAQTINQTSTVSGVESTMENAQPIVAKPQTNAIPEVQTIVEPSQSTTITQPQNYQQTSQIPSPVNQLNQQNGTASPNGGGQNNEIS